MFVGCFSFLLPAVHLLVTCCPIHSHPMRSTHATLLATAITSTYNSPMPTPTPSPKATPVHTSLGIKYISSKAIFSIRNASSKARLHADLMKRAAPGVTTNVVKKLKETTEDTRDTNVGPPSSRFGDDVNNAYIAEFEPMLERVRGLFEALRTRLRSISPKVVPKIQSLRRSSPP